MPLKAKKELEKKENNFEIEVKKKYTLDIESLSIGAFDTIKDDIADEVGVFFNELDKITQIDIIEKIFENILQEIKES